MRRTTAILILLTLTLTACAPGRDLRGVRAFPEHAASANTIDVQAFVFDRTLRITNTTAQTLGPGRLWLNRWYSRDFPALAVGQRVDLPLRSFRDRYGEAIREGGFFATETPERVILAELAVPVSEAAGEGSLRLVPLVVVSRRDDR